MCPEAIALILNPRITDHTVIPVRMQGSIDTITWVTALQAKQENIGTAFLSVFDRDDGSSLYHKFVAYRDTP